MLVVYGSFGLVSSTNLDRRSLDFIFENNILLYHCALIRTYAPIGGDQWT
ncbi:hypothetical protein [Novosphingobium panipatense]